MPRARLSKAAQQQESDEHWKRVTAMWMSARNEVPPEAMVLLGEFQDQFFGLMAKHSASPAIVLVALSHLFAPVVMEHMRHGPPPHVTENQWHRAIYDAIQDAIIIAHSVLDAVEGRRVVTGPDNTLQKAPVH